MPHSSRAKGPANQGQTVQVCRHTSGGSSAGTELAAAGLCFFPEPGGRPRFFLGGSSADAAATAVSAAAAVAMSPVRPLKLLLRPRSAKCAELTVTISLSIEQLYCIAPVAHGYAINVNPSTWPVAIGRQKVP